MVNELTTEQSSFEQWVKELKVSSQYVPNQPKPFGYYYNLHQNTNEIKIESKPWMKTK